ncbi:unnamed protein product [Paramecium pentaurelia]|uniref:START domain-containing protein n=1 Tax=Paramecium pentaurelia TaxID=43138 RepID=A0A8S1SDY3_9CILI|nr:unnamed protein product [Paramecium pentaurelia]
MNQCIIWIKLLLRKCLSIFQYTKIRTADSHYQMQQFNQVELNLDKDIENNLKEELKNENYETELTTSDLDTKIQSQKQQLIEKQEIIEIIQQPIDISMVRQFIETTPNVNIQNKEILIELGQKSIEIYHSILYDYEGYEQLEDNQDEFSYWIKYIETPEKFQIHQMRYKYTLNTTIEKYMAFMKDLELQKKLDSSIDQFESHFSDDSLQINYLRYKKILFMDPRDFLFVKYTKYIDENTVFEISKSIENDEFQPFNPSSKSTTRAYLLMSGNYIKQVEQNKLEIQTYSECNMKLKLKPMMTKTASKNEIKKLIKKYRDHFNQQ